MRNDDAREAQPRYHETIVRSTPVGRIKLHLLQTCVYWKKLFDGQMLTRIKISIRHPNVLFPFLNTICAVGIVLTNSLKAILKLR